MKQEDEMVKYRRLFVAGFTAASVATLVVQIWVATSCTRQWGFRSTTKAIIPERMHVDDEAAPPKSSRLSNEWAWETKRNDTTHHRYPEALQELTPERIITMPSQICGHSKCFFQVRQDKQDTQSVGYLASNRFEHVRESMVQAWKLVQKRFRDPRDHIYLAPPQIIQISTDFGQWLDRNLTLMGRTDKKTKVRFSGSDTVMVQRVRFEDPERSFLLGASTKKQTAAWAKADELIRTVLAKTSVKARHDMIDQLNESWERFLELMLIEPCIVHDFQILWRADDARFVHLDMDRCFFDDGTMRPFDLELQRAAHLRVGLFVDFFRSSLATGKVPNATDLLAQSLAAFDVE